MCIYYQTSIVQVGFFVTILSLHVEYSEQVHPLYTQPYNPPFLSPFIPQYLLGFSLLSSCVCVTYFSFLPSHSH
jgi:hypothetical protein